MSPNLEWIVNYPCRKKVAMSDFVLWGGGAMEFLTHQVQQLDRTLSKPIQLNYITHAS